MGNRCSGCVGCVDRGDGGRKEIKSGFLYDEYRENIKSLDLILFRGGDYISDFIRFMEAKHSGKHSGKKQKKYNIPADAFSHVGLVVKSDILNDSRLSPEKIYVWESTMSGSLSEDGVSSIDGKAHFGVQLRDFDKVIEAYDSGPNTRIAISHLLPKVDCEALRDKFTELFKQYNGTAYDANPVSLASTVFSCLRPIRDDVEGMLGTEDFLFCSEFAALILKELGFYDEDTNPKNVVPMDFLGFDSDTDEKGGLPCIYSNPTYVVSKVNTKSTQSQCKVNAKSTQSQHTKIRK